MSNKTAECYKAVFKFIEDNVFKLEPESFITDFENGLRAAIRYQYPTTILRGCWYHYCCSLSRHIKRMGNINAIINSKPEAALIKGQLMNFPLLPKNKFSEGYRYIKQQVCDCNLQEELKDLLIYFENTWIRQVKNKDCQKRYSFIRDFYECCLVIIIVSNIFINVPNWKWITIYMIEMFIENG